MAANPNLTHNPMAPAGYKAWAEELLRPDVACKLFEGYAEALAMIAAKREALKQADIASFSGRIAGFSPSGNTRIHLEMPYVASLLLKAALGRDCLQDPRKRAFIARQHPEFDLTIRR